MIQNEVAAAANAAIQAREALPVPVLIAIIVGFFAVILYGMRKIGGLKKYLEGPPPFPTHAATVIAGIGGFSGFVFVATCRLALGMRFPDGYDGIMFLIGSTLGVVGVWGVGKRATSAEREGAKTTAALAMTAAQNSVSPAPQQQVNANAGSSVVMATDAASRQAATPARAPAPAATRAIEAIDPPGEGD